MGLPTPSIAPWIFVAMAHVPRGFPALPAGGFIPVPSPALDGLQFAQMLQPGGPGGFQVIPQPKTNNGNPITCRSNAVPGGLPVAERAGIATADLFTTPAPSEAQARLVIERIADPATTHFFNTDCVSCHTDTRRAMQLLHVSDVPGVDKGVLPTGDYNVRNFGWSEESASKSTATRRVAAETAAVVAFINAEVLNR